MPSGRPPKTSSPEFSNAIRFQKGAGAGSNHPCPTEDSNNGSTPKRQRKEKVTAMLTEEEEQSMVEWLVSNPILYNRKLKNYKHTSRKEALWREKAEEVGKDVLILKTWYTSLRTRYGRLKKLCAGQESPELTERDFWILGCFEFLRPHIIEIQRRRRRKEKVGVSVDDTPPIEDDLGHDADEVDADPPATHLESVKLQPVSPLSSTSSTKPSTATCGRGVAADEEDETLLTSLCERPQHFLTMQQQQQQLHGLLRPEDERERDAFAEWLRSAMRNFEHSVWRRSQRELTDVMYRFIAENDALRIKKQPPCSSSAGPTS
ncbi:uncharacterized protein LOC106513442 isoform X2 [Austrofundulus limnaeus]|uniref:Uncharacterized protein LOC106513442 isoform X2 n=1 Tax=Austrofundulus limnaeus TaxID=52670 RepID=A0A2I4AQF2_AUSLI|nr:PREDICTED: uncharacterized protein LOC106513442 isoform X2 [Austrofundulus limnaeus]